MFNDDSLYHIYVILALNEWKCYSILAIKSLYKVLLSKTQKEMDVNGHYNHTYYKVLMPRTFRLIPILWIL